jgi:hypothetical protein
MCSLADEYERLRGTCCLHLQGMSEVNREKGATGAMSESVGTMDPTELLCQWGKDEAS